MDRSAGRVGSKSSWILAGHVGSGHAFSGSGRVGLQNLDPRATLGGTLRTNHEKPTEWGDGWKKCNDYCNCNKSLSTRLHMSMKHMSNKRSCLIKQYTETIQVTQRNPSKRGRDQIRHLKLDI